MNEGYSLFYKISLGVVSLLFIIVLVLFFVYFQKADRTEEYINSRISEATSIKEDEMVTSCELQKKEIQENPWVSYTAPNMLGAFSYQYPRGWSKHQIFDINAQIPYTSYFNPDMVEYDSSLRNIHAPLEVYVSKNLYSKELDGLEKKAVKSKEKYEISDIKISEFNGRKFYYKDQDLQRFVNVIIIPYRDRTLIIKTDNARDYQNYFDQFAESFILTP